MKDYSVAFPFPTYRRRTRKGRIEIEQTAYQQIVKISSSLTQNCSFAFGTITAYQKKNRTIKAILEPSGIETGWCRCLQGAYADKIGLEIVLGRIAEGNMQQYIVLGIVE